jgi:hypothetical protein
MVRRFVPRALELRDEMRAGGIDEQRIGRKERGDGEPFALHRFVLDAAVNGQHDRQRYFTRGAL